MPPIPNQQNANSAPPASAGGNPQTGIPTTGPIPVSALADALVNSGAFAESTDTQVQPGSSDPGAGAEPGGELPPGDGALPGSEEAPLESGSETENQTPDDLPLLDLQDPQTAPPSGGTEPQDPAGYKKRIDRLLADNRRLSAELAEARNAPPAPPQNGHAAPGGALDAIDSVDALDKFSRLATQAIDDVGDILARIDDEPEAAEEFIRSNNREGFKLTDAQGQEDWSPKRMRAWLIEKRSDVRQKLRHAPERRQVLQQQQAAHAQLLQFFPFLDDKTDPRYAKVHELFGQFPGVRQLPNAEWACLCFLEGEKSLKAKLQTRAKLNPAVTGRRSAAPPNTAASGAPPPVSRTKSQIDKAKDAVRNTRSKEALANLFEATNFARGK